MASGIRRTCAFLLLALVVAAWMLLGRDDGAPPREPAGPAVPGSEVPPGVASIEPRGSGDAGARVPAELQPPSGSLAAVGTGEEVVRLLLDGPGASAFRGVARVRRHGGDRGVLVDEDLRIDGPEVRIGRPATVAWVVLAVEGFTIARVGPGERPFPDVMVPLQPAGIVRVEVHDSSGAPLRGRLVICSMLRPPAAQRGVEYQARLVGRTDYRGVATIGEVVTGTHKVKCPAVGEWQEATQFGVEVRPGLVTDVSIQVDVRPAGEYGGFCFAQDDASFIRPAEGGGVEHYAFWTEGDHSFPIDLVDGMFRCVVPGEMGAQMRGRIEARDSYRRPIESLRASEPIVVTVGAMVVWRPQWSR